MFSCRKKEKGWVVAMNGWKTLTDTSVTKQTVQEIEAYCSELLIHAADVEGLCQGIDEELVESRSCTLSTYLLWTRLIRQDWENG